MLSITRHFDFCASHRLLTSVPEQHPCNCLHGHNYEGSVRVIVGPRFDADMILDFSHLKEIVNDVMGFFDHRTILKSSDPIIQNLTEIKQRITVLRNDPTVEFMTQVLSRMFAVRILQRMINQDRWKDALEVKSVEVNLSETSNSFGTASLDFDFVIPSSVTKFLDESAAKLLQDISIVQ